nr:TetR/AcrR family transcriptional regulator [candidate division Zixibacteria bacterium]
MPAEKRRSQLIRAAEKVFARKGYLGSTTEEIARSAGLTKGALYFHFKGKEDIFFEVIRQINENNLNSIEKYIKSDLDLETSVEMMIRSAFEMIEKNRYFKADFWKQAYDIPHIRKYMCRSHEDLVDRLVGYLMDNSHLGQEDSEDFITIINAVIDGLVTRIMFEGERLNIERLTDRVVKISKLYLKKDLLGMG